MSQNFLNQLLSRTENRVISSPGERCMICLEDYNMLNMWTGITEYEIRLPCNHHVGSSCIANWLRTNNSCPQCRATFFAARPRPYPQHGNINQNRLAPDPRTTRSTVERPRDVSYTLTSSGRPREGLNGDQRDLDAAALTQVFCSELDFTDRATAVAGLAESMAGLLAGSRDGQGHSPRRIAAVCIYMAAYIIRRQKSLMEISWVAGVSGEDIARLYGQIYSVREQLIDWGDLERRGSDCTIRTMRAIDPTIWPSLQRVERELRGIV
ncbi:MAG: hypothetical protein Q9161_000193 [Pseudevernia consocians]